MESKSKQRQDIDLIGDTEMKSAFNHVVDYITAKRVGPSGKVEYLVKWEGWSHSTATWEPPVNFASPQVADIFEEGIRKEIGIPEPSVADEPIPSNNKNKRKKAVPKRKSEPMASKLWEDMRKRSNKVKRNPKEMSAQKLFDVEVTRIESVIKRYEPLVGASKRKSRMSCPSSPIKVKPSPPKPVSDRSKRLLKRNLKTGQPNSDNSISNSSLEENKNPSNENQSGITSNFKRPKNSRKRQMKVNNDSNRMSYKISQNLFPEELEDFGSESQDNTFDQNLLEDSPSKVFLNKVKERLSPIPEQYKQFLNEIIEFQSINLEFNKLLDNNEELIGGFFNILFINRELIKDNDPFSTLCLMKSDEEINEHIFKWLERVDQKLENHQKEEFWAYIKNKGKHDILKASPDYLWLRINKMLRTHTDLSEEFKNFMPTLCSKIYSLYSKH